MINAAIESLEVRKAFIFQQFSFYEHSDKISLINQADHEKSFIISRPEVGRS